MADFTELLTQADFSRETDLKSRLRRKLFRTEQSKKVVAFQPIEDDSLILVNAAQGLQKTNPFEDPFEDLMNKKNQK